ncbi:MAG: hypothetical protein A2096_03425 [Spirochaetes bacterium GWF1_41_5]|nr:MAG: hypothetical protein A2096_03425 [Spirochaetes bacterium GWF1_41_5]
MKISGAESLSAASNIFVGVESALTVRPYISGMTRSELAVMLTAGMATVSSNVMAVYVFFLHKEFPTIAGHLVSASILSAPAAVLMAKLLVPETGLPLTMGKDTAPYYEKEDNIFASVINGSMAGLKLIAGIAALLIAILGFTAVIDVLFKFTGQHINRLGNWHIDWSLKAISGYLMIPFVYIMGIPVQDAGIAAKIIGSRTIITELTAYLDLANAIKGGLITSRRSMVIITYALCGFAHIASLGIFVGGIAALAPERIKDLSGLGLKCLLAATLACLLTACMAGIFFTQNSVLLP